MVLYSTNNCLPNYDTTVTVVAREMARLEKPQTEKTMNIFDQIHERFFDELFGFDNSDGSKEEMARKLREMGCSPSDIKEITSGLLRPGMTLGGAHTIDVKLTVEKALFQQRAEGITLRVSKPPYDEAGHIEIQVLDVENKRAQEASDDQLMTNTIRAINRAAVDLREAAVSVIELLERGTAKLEEHNRERLSIAVMHLNDIKKEMTAKLQKREGGDGRLQS